MTTCSVGLCDNHRLRILTLNDSSFGFCWCNNFHECVVRTYCGIDIIYQVVVHTIKMDASLGDITQFSHLLVAVHTLLLFDSYLNCYGSYF